MTGGVHMRDEVALAIVGVVAIAAVGITYMVVFKQNGAVLGTICTAIGTIIGGVVGYKLKKT